MPASCVQSVRTGDDQRTSRYDWLQNSSRGGWGTFASEARRRGRSHSNVPAVSAAANPSGCKPISPANVFGRRRYYKNKRHSRAAAAGGTIVGVSGTAAIHHRKPMRTSNRPLQNTSCRTRLRMGSFRRRTRRRGDVSATSQSTCRNVAPRRTQRRKFRSPHRLSSIVRSDRTRPRPSAMLPQSDAG